MNYSKTWFCFIAILLLSVFAFTASAQSTEPNSDLEAQHDFLVQQHNLLEKYRAFDRETRHFHYVVVNAILSSYGGWRNLPQDYNATQIGLIDGVIDKMAPEVNRMRVRASSYQGISEDEANQLIDAAAQFQELFVIGIQIRDHLYLDEIDEANGVYYEQALPLFEAIWNTNYTLMAQAARRLPTR